MFKFINKIKNFHSFKNYSTHLNNSHSLQNQQTIKSLVCNKMMTNNSLTVHYVSNLYLDKKSNDFKLQFNPDEKKYNVLIVAGNIASPFSEEFNLFFDEASKKFDKTLFVPGNHDFVYDNDFEHNDTHYFKPVSHLTQTYFSTVQMEHVAEKFIDLKQKYFSTVQMIQAIQKYNNVELLNNTMCQVGNFKFAGTTLFSYRHMAKTFNDIQNNKLHKRSVDFVSSLLKNHEKNSIIVISSYNPSFSVVDYNLDTNDIEEYIALTSSLDHMMTNKSPIKLWITGAYGNNNKGYSKINKSVLCVWNSHSLPKINNNVISLEKIDL